MTDLTAFLKIVSPAKDPFKSRSLRLLSSSLELLKASTSAFILSSTVDVSRVTEMAAVPVVVPLSVKVRPETRR